MEKPETTELKNTFARITKRMPKSASLGVGSMRPYIAFRMGYTLEVRDFVKQYYRGNKSFRGVDIKYVSNVFEDEWHMKYGYTFHVEKSKLTKPA